MAIGVNQLRDWVFKKVHTSNLVYNTCWEDPRCDRELMEFDSDSSIVMITSAGCNALDYLLDHPRQINCIDMNPRQNALLHLKLAAIKHNSFEDLFHLFGQGVHPNIKEYYQRLRPSLPAFAAEYWDTRLNFFNGKGLRKSFYYYGTSGTFALLVKQYVKSLGNVNQKIQQLFEAKDLEEQRAIYFEIEERILNKLVAWVMNRHVTLTLLGVPRSQRELVLEKYQKGVMGFIKACFRQVFTELSLKDNYFWHVYLKGAYTKDCAPNYLLEKHQADLRANAARINIHTTTISQFLKEHPGNYSHFILLDHQDWLAANNIPALEEEWELILKNSRPGTRILLRSAAERVDFFPDFVLDALDFEQEVTAATHKRDRVGTYASVYMGTVK
ncbi:MAG: BtaA family protein [Bacteroidota bacterium]